MNKERGLEIEIIEGKTIRESSGLALSSRNLLLSDRGKEKAALLYRILKEVKKEFSDRRELDAFELLSSRYLNIGIDYLEILDLETFSKPTEKTDKYIILVAAIIEDVRLIDNIEFKLEGE
jgi:pantoate--beta-alanine ligase